MTFWQVIKLRDIYHPAAMFNLLGRLTCAPDALTSKNL